jgi:hypothetical protein
MNLKELEELSELELAYVVIGLLRRGYREGSDSSLTEIEAAIVSGGINAWDTIFVEKAAEPDDFRMFALDIVRNI